MAQLVPGLHRDRLLPCFLPDGRIIHAYDDRTGFLLTEDMDGLTRPVQDVCRKVLHDLWGAARHPPPGHGDRKLNVLASKELLDTRTLVESSITNAYSLLQSTPNVLASKELLDTTTLESITNASSLPQPAPLEERELNVLVSKELFDTTVLEESSTSNASSLLQPATCENRESNVLASKEVLDTTTLESSVTNAYSLPQATLPLKEDQFPTPQLLQARNKDRDSYELWLTQQPSRSDMLSSKELLIVKALLGKSSIMDASSTRAEPVTRSLTPHISARKPAGWNHQFFIRKDLKKVFHTYPKLGGPFYSLDEAEKAILSRLDELRDPNMCTNNGLSSSEIAMRDALHWPDGTRKYPSRSNPDKDHMGLLVQALLDKYNEENTLLGDDAYHVEDVVSFQEVYEGKGGWYYHLNCTIKTKGGVNSLFFVEVLKMIRGQLDDFKLTCLHMVKPAVGNGTCYGCKENNAGMKHPIDTGKYKGGHDPSWPRCCGVSPLGLPKDVVDARMKAMEERIRHLLKDPDLVKSDAGRIAAADARMKAMEERIRNPFQDHDVVKSDSGRMAPAYARINNGRTRYLYGDGHVAKSDAGRTAACLEGKRGKYVVPALRQLV